MFCILEKNEKTYKYLQMVVEYLREKKVDGFVQLDNQLQRSEILNHLHLNRLPADDREEMLKWIQDYGKGFRDYLNTIKVAALMWSWAEERKELSWEDFYGLAERLNSVKACLDAIHE